MLFLIFANDFHKVTKYLDLVMFADDTNLFNSHKNIKTLSEIVNSELKLVNEWFLTNEFSLNAKNLMHKTKYGKNLPIFLPKFREVDHQYPTRFSQNNFYYKSLLFHLEQLLKPTRKISLSSVIIFETN